jgi:hypothetical protein
LSARTLPVTFCRYASPEEAFPHIQAIVLQEQEAASARASRGEVDLAADGDADATTSSASDDKAVNVRSCFARAFTFHIHLALQVSALVAVLKEAVAAVGATAAAPEAATCSHKDFLGRPVPQVPVSLNIVDGEPLTHYSAVDCAGLARHVH